MGYGMSVEVRTIGRSGEYKRARVMVTGPGDPPILEDIVQYYLEVPSILIRCTWFSRRLLCVEFWTAISDIWVLGPSGMMGHL